MPPIYLAAITVFTHFYRSNTVNRLLAQMGLSPQRPLYKSYKQKPKELRRFLEETFPGLREQARRTGAVIFFVDEAAVRSDAHRGTTWGKIGRTPVVKDSGDRFGMRLISAVSPRGDMKFASFTGSMNGDKFVEFLKKLRRDVPGPLIIIADNASYHGSAPIQEYVKQSQGGLVVEHLPRYSPELNPDEQVWNQAKLELGKLCITTRLEMKKAVSRILRSIQRRVGLIKSFFPADRPDPWSPLSRTLTWPASTPSRGSSTPRWAINANSLASSPGFFIRKPS